MIFFTEVAIYFTGLGLDIEFVFNLVWTNECIVKSHFTYTL